MNYIYARHLTSYSTMLSNAGMCMCPPLIFTETQHKMVLYTDGLDMASEYSLHDVIVN